jgi:hypothetical protein
LHLLLEVFFQQRHFRKHAAPHPAPKGKDGIRHRSEPDLREQMIHRGRPGLSLSGYRIANRLF